MVNHSSVPSMLWDCWLGGRKGIRPVKTEWWGAGMVICLERGAYLHTAQLMPLPLTVSCFSKIQIGFPSLVPADPGSPGQRAVKRVCLCVWVNRSSLYFSKWRCGSQVLVQRSIRRPKRLTVRGNDEKDYRYLVKCGEDLRQDERIMQLLTLMNHVYSRHATCKQRHLRLRTYHVVPMTTRLVSQLVTTNYLQCFETVGWASGRTCKNWVMRCWCGYLSGAKCILFPYGTVDATASQNPIIFCLI